MSDRSMDRIFASWLAPLSPDSACGENCTLTPEFEEIKAEVEKCESLHVCEPTDWELVLARSTAFLASQSKDLWIVSYSLRAVYECYGLKGLLVGLGVLEKFIEKYWDALHPGLNRPKRRAAPFIWLAAKFEILLPAMDFSAVKNSSEKLRESIQSIQNFLAKKLETATPDFSSLLKSIPEGSSAKAEKDSSEGFQVPQATAAAPPLASISSTLPDGGIPASSLPQLLRATQENLQQLAGHYLGQNMTDWRIYLLHRAGLWGTISQLPQADISGVTQLRSVPKDRALAYQSAVDGKRYAEILPQLERTASKSPFWFDGHRLVCICLEELGAIEGLRFIQSVLLQFLGRFPELLVYKYHDGTPFASPKTIHWIESLQSRTSQEYSSHIHPAGLSSASDEGADEALLRDALALCAEKDFKTGLAHLGPAYPSRSRGAIKQSLLKAQYCMAAGRTRNAHFLLAELYAQLETWNLLEWEPELTAKILSLLLSTQDKGDGFISEQMVRRWHWLHMDTALAVFK